MIAMAILLSAWRLALAIAVRNGYLEIARCLLEQGANRDKASHNGWTPLHNAAGVGQLEIAILL